MSSKFNLWKLLNEYRVIIPIIQRDYAQGRKENDYIRKTFLKDIKNCLCSEPPKQLTLDFIYGNIECKNGDDKRFYPLDGQQRLTTLWLVYWYVSFKSGKLSEDGERLKKFTYETRRSSRDFCIALCDNVDGAKTVNESIVEYIKSQTWFYSAWLQDPTISAMLRTLGGEGDNNIEKIFEQCDFNNLRLRLIKADSNPIQFELMIIGGDKLPISDDLYIKMNARGKPLTNFENFKADLMAWIQDPQNGDRKNFDNVKDTASQLSYSQYFPLRIDNAWTDVFWNYAKKNESFDGKIDDQYFAFINRFVVNEICSESELKPDEFGQKKGITSLSDDKKRVRIAFDKLIGAHLKEEETDDSLVKYEGFKIYKDYLNFNALNNLDTIFNKLLEQKGLVEEIDAVLQVTNTDEYDRTGYSFIPVYDYEKHAIVPTSQKERVYFFAICRFLLEYESEKLEDDLKKWMRVVKNLTENAAIDNVSAMITCMRLIGKLDVNDVYASLCNINVPDSQLGRQLKEEKEKAEKIRKNPDLEGEIIKAEQYAFFNGSIRFLYRNGFDEDWDNFYTRFETAKMLFADKSNEVGERTIKNLLEYFPNFEEIKEKHLFTSIGYHARRACWKRDILCSEDGGLLGKVNSLLTRCVVPEKKFDYKTFLDNKMVEQVVKQTDNYKYRYHWYCGDYAIHKESSRTEGVYVSQQRLDKNKALITTSSIELDQSNFEQYIWGVKIKFKYKNNYYIWDGENNIRRSDKGIESENSEKWEGNRDLISCLNKLSRP